MCAVFDEHGCRVGNTLAIHLRGVTLAKAFLGDFLCASKKVTRRKAEALDFVKTQIRSSPASTRAQAHAAATRHPTTD